MIYNFLVVARNIRDIPALQLELSNCITAEGCGVTFYPKPIFCRLETLPLTEQDLPMELYDPAMHPDSSLFMTPDGYKIIFGDQDDCNEQYASLPLKRRIAILQKVIFVILKSSSLVELYLADDNTTIADYDSHEIIAPDVGRFLESSILAEAPYPPTLHLLVHG